MTDTEIVRGKLIAQAEKLEALAEKYRRTLIRAEIIGNPYPDGSFRGPYGNARDELRGWHYSPRIRNAAIRAEQQAILFRTAADAIKL